MSEMILTSAGRIQVCFSVRTDTSLETFERREDALVHRAKLLAGPFPPDPDDLVVAVEPPWCGEDEHYCGMDGLPEDFTQDADGIWVPRPEWWAKWATWQCCRSAADA